MKKTFVLASLAGVLLQAGCATQSAYVTDQPNRYIVNTGKINVQDFEQAADQMIGSLNDHWIGEGKLKSGAEGEPAILAISRIQNSTGQQLDTDLLVKKIRVALNRTGKVVTTTTMGLGGAEDPLAADSQKEKEFFADKKHTRGFDYTLSGKIIEDRARAGNARQSAFIFQLSLTSNDGLAVWEEEKPIVKQGTRPSVGF